MSDLIYEVWNIDLCSGQFLELFNISIHYGIAGNDTLNKIKEVLSKVEILI